MVAARANWKGYLKIGDLSCPVALYTGASNSERITSRTLNRDTGNRVRREFFDPVTNKTVDREQQVKGYEVDKDELIQLEPDEVAKAVPEGTKLLAVAAFVPCEEIDTVYFDKPYYLSPASKTAEDAFAVIREALRDEKVGALAHAVLFRRYRGVMIRAHGAGLVAHTLHFDYEVRSAKAAFDGISKLKIKGEMLDLAQHIIKTKTGTFDPSAFDDRYEAALADLVEAKMAGKPVKAVKRKAEPKVTDLIAALKASVGADAPKPKRARKPAKQAAPLKKAS